MDVAVKFNILNGKRERERESFQNITNQSHRVDKLTGQVGWMGLTLQVRQRKGSKGDNVKASEISRSLPN